MLQGSCAIRRQRLLFLGGHMNKSHHVLTALGVLIFGGWAAHLLVAAAPDPAFECVSAPVSTNGWNHRDRPLAEMAAILRWKEAADSRLPGYAAWHNAQGRKMSCKLIGKSTLYFQCRASATPCRRAAHNGA